MMWAICFVLALLIFAVCNIGGYLSYRRNRRSRRALSLVTLFLGVTFFSLFLLILPLCRELFIGSRAVDLQTFFQTIRISLQVFSLDGEYLDLYESVASLPAALRGAYRIFGGILYVLAPILLVGVVVSFFQSILDYAKLKTVKFKNIYIFSELNERSLVLARSCAEHDRAGKKGSLLVFTDVYEKDEEESAEVISWAKNLGAICLKSDILTLNVDFSRKKTKVRFFIMGSDETENIRHALTLTERYGQCDRISLHVVTNSEEGELLVGSAMNTDIRMEVKRINSAQSMVYSYLFDTENHRLFDLARTLPDGERVLTIVLVGMGQYGTELLRALTWYTQLPGIRTEIHVFERDHLAEQRFASLCPETMEMNHKDIDGESHFDIYFHHTAGGWGIDADTSDFDRQIAELHHVSIAYLTLGDDAANIRIAVKLRRLFTQSVTEEPQPVIEAVVFDAKKSEIVKKYPMQDFKGKGYNIGFIGDMETTWSYDVILQDSLEAEAKTRHLKWVDKSSADYEEQLRKESRRFYQHEYFRQSSMASAIRSRVRREMHVPGTDKAPGQRTEEERRAIQKVEHAGWNAYMRSIGYRYAPERNDMAKLHHLLIPFEDLPESEKIKDDD
ncbi:MAG: hypothetical protein LUE92_12005 [Clostridiales bacterium]|nr:hypothetical protein [Clostridiales bacterium]